MEFAHRLGFQVEKADGMLEDQRDRLLADMLHSLPKEIFRFHESAPENLSVSFKEHLLNSTVTTDTTWIPEM